MYRTILNSIWKVISLSPTALLIKRLNARLVKTITEEKRPPTFASQNLNNFTDLLRQANINNPDARVLEVIMRVFSSRMLVTITAAAAAELYEAAKNLPGTSTRVIIEQQSSITINGPYSENCDARILTAVDGNGVPLIIKILVDPTNTPKEINACRILELDSSNSENRGLISASITQVTIPTSDVSITRTGQGVFSAICMPHYTKTLAEVPQLSERAIARNIPRMISALEWIHSKNLVHMDVRAPNIFVRYDGCWVLGDFDATVANGNNGYGKYGATHYPNRLSFPDPLNPFGKIKVPASPEIDWYMLLATLCIELNKRDWLQLMDRDSGKISHEKILTMVESCRMTSVKPLLETIAARALPLLGEY